jgi:hypothetical protein
MNVFIKAICVVFATLSVSVCNAMSNPPSSDDEDTTTPSEPSTQEILGKLDFVHPDAQSRYKAFEERQFRKVSHINCNNTLDDQCDEVSSRFSEGRFNQVDSRETIMVMDNGYEALATLRYRSRIKGYFQFKDGHWMDYDPEVNSKRYVKTLLERIDEKGYTPNGLYTRIGREIINRRDFLPDGHGVQILNFLADYNPQAEFILVDRSSFTDAIIQSACAYNYDEDRAVAQKDQIINQTRYFLREMNIDFLNFSAGYSLPRLQESFNTICGEPIAFAKKHVLIGHVAAIFESFLNSEGVMAFQALGNRINWRTHPFETQYQWANRILVGGYSVLASGVPESGDYKDLDRKIRYLSAIHQSSYDYGDVFINVGLEDKQTPESVWDIYEYTPTSLTSSSTDGLGLYRFGLMPKVHTSFVTPVALSYAIHISNYLKQRGLIDNELTNESIKIIKSYMVPNTCGQYRNELCKIQDPLLHKAFEVYRLGYYQ